MITAVRAHTDIERRSDAWLPVANGTPSMVTERDGSVNAGRAFQMMGSCHWNIIDGEDGECQVVPLSQRVLGPFGAILQGGLAAGILLWARLPLAERLACAGVMGVFGAAWFWLWEYFDRTQKKLGPYVQLNKTGVQLRGEPKVGLNSTYRFGTRREYIKSSEGVEVTWLYLSCSSGKYDIVCSWEHNKVHALKDTLNHKLSLLKHKSEKP